MQTRRVIPPRLRRHTVLPLALVLLALTATVAGSTERLPAAILSELNLARTAPADYAEVLAARRPFYRGQRYRLPGAASDILTTEGLAAVDETIAFLRAARPLPPLTWSEGLAQAAATLMQQQSMDGSTGHGSGASALSARVDAQGQWQKALGENVAYGPATGREVVIQLLIDDGVPGRGHRRNIFSPDFAVAGAACAPHPHFTTGCAIDFAGGFISQPSRHDGGEKP